MKPSWGREFSRLLFITGCPPDQKPSRSPAGPAGRGRARCWLVQPESSRFFPFNLSSTFPAVHRVPPLLGNSQIPHPPTRICSRGGPGGTVPLVRHPRREGSRGHGANTEHRGGRTQAAFPTFPAHFQTKEALKSSSTFDVCFDLKLGAPGRCLHVTCDQSPADAKPGSSLSLVSGWRACVHGRSRVRPERILLLLLPGVGRAALV